MVGVGRLSHLQRILLLAVSENPGISERDLVSKVAAEWGWTDSSIKGSLGRLYRRGFLRSPDRDAYPSYPYSLFCRVYLTPKGEEEI